MALFEIEKVVQLLSFQVLICLSSYRLCCFNLLTLILRVVSGLRTGHVKSAFLGFLFFHTRQQSRYFLLPASLHFS